MLCYREAFETYVGIEYTNATLDDHQKLCKSNWTSNTCIYYLITHQIEPKLGQGELTVLADFPPHEAALACVKMKNGELVAERYEIYHEGVELTNG